AVSVRIFPRIIHRFQNRFGWAVWVFIVGQFGHLFVLGFGIFGWTLSGTRVRTSRSALSLLSRKFEGAKTRGTDRCRNPSHESASSNVTLQLHFPSVFGREKMT